MCWKQVLVSHNLNSALSGLCRSPDIVSTCANWSELLWVTVTCALCQVSVHSCFTLHLHWNFQSSLKASHYSVFGVTKNPSYDVSCTLLFFFWIIAVIAGIFIITRQRSWASLSIGNTLWRVWTTFTCSAITPPEMNGFGWNFGHSEYIVWSWPWQILGVICTEARVGALADFLFFCWVSNARFNRLPVDQISRNLHTICGSTSWWILSEQNFQNLPARVRFFQKPTSSRTTSDFIQR